MRPSIEKILPTTTFPDLSTTYDYSQIQLPSTNGDLLNHPQKPRSVIEANFAQDRCLGFDNILDGFARFVKALTGEDEIAFLFTSKDDQSSRIVRGIACATFVHEVPAVEVFENPEDEESPFHNQLESLQLDFAIEYVRRNDLTQSTYLSSSVPFVLEVVEDDQNRILRMHSHHDLLPNGLERIMLDTVTRYQNASVNESSTSYHIPEEQLSVLNHPPRSKPIPLAVDNEGEWTGSRKFLLHSAFERRAQQFPQRKAIDFLQNLSDHGKSGHQELTYSQLDSITDALAVEIIAKTTSKDLRRTPIVPAYIATSVELYVAWLAVLKAGFTFCPLSTDSTVDQLEHILEDTSAELVLGTGSRPSTKPWSSLVEDTKTSSASCHWFDVQAFIRSNPECRGKPGINCHEHGIAYLMYTSGTTGRPKGVQISHLAASCSISCHCALIPASYPAGGYRWFQFAAPTFDPSVMEIFTTLSTGGTICATTRDALLTDPEAVINELQADIMMATPSTANLLRPEHVPLLRNLWTMGESLNRSVIERFAGDSRPGSELDQDHPQNLLNAYGPTEAGINCSALKGVSINDKGTVIGSPFPTCSLLVLEPNSSSIDPVALGMCGELAIGGPQLSSGYLDMPARTEKAFVDSPTYGRLYRTGDRARVVKHPTDGFALEFLGRLSDDQVKLSGRRVELGQIESAFASGSSIKEMAASIHCTSQSKGSEQVMACIVPNLPIDEDKLMIECRSAAEKRLPYYMRPTKYFLFHQLPRSTSGKIDRKKLRRLAGELWSNVQHGPIEGNEDRPCTDGVPTDSPEYSSGTAEAKNVLLSQIKDTIATTFPQSNSHIADQANLLTLGIDSLSSVSLLRSLRESGITGVSVADVLGSSTLIDLASTIRHRTSAGQAEQPQSATDNSSFLESFADDNAQACATALHATEKEIQKVLPATATQSGMISSFLRSCETSSSRRYVNHSIYHVNPAYRIDSIKRAWLVALGHDAIWRTTFVQVDDDRSPFAQCIISPTSHLSQLMSRTFVPCNRTEDEKKAAISQAMIWAEETMTLEKPPIRVSFIVSPSGSAVILSLFHGIFDGGSLELLLRDVSRIMHGESLSDHESIDVAVHQHFDADLNAAESFWKSHLRNFTPTPFPSLSPQRPELASKKSEVVEFVGQTSLEGLQSASQTLKASPLSILQASWSTLLLSYVGFETEVCFGSVISDRLDEIMTNCQAPTFVTVPVRITSGTVWKAKEHLKTSQIIQNLTKMNADALRHLHTPLGSQAMVDGKLPYDTLLAFQLFPQSNHQSDIWEAIEFPPMDNDFVVMLEIWPTAIGSLRFRATYKPTNLDESTAITMLQQLDGIIQNIMRQPELSLSQISSQLSAPLLSQNPEKQAFQDHVPRLQTPFQLHAQQAPDEIALTYCNAPEQAHWSYRRLDELSNAWADTLITQFKVCRGDIVMICMEKCLELYPAILSILKAGAAWCPIDPYSPPARRNDLITIAGGKTLLVAGKTQSATAIPAGVTLIDVTKSLGIDSRLPNPPPVSGTQPDDIAYLIFTSGTTGTPKGVPITHRAACTAISSLQQSIPGPTNGLVRSIQFSQSTFDIFVQDLFYTWALGGTLISSTRDTLLQSFTQLANSTRATHVNLTPSFAATLRRKEFESLEVLTLIGEKLTSSVADEWGEEMKTFNTYGPAEATIVSTYRLLDGPNDKIKACNIGVPLPSVGCYAVNSDGRVMPKLASGELALSGDQLSSGYWRSKEVTSKKFVWIEQIQKWAYLTGDIVRFLADGTIEFIGRNDDMVKLGGIRVELGEIANAVHKSHASIRQVEVLLLAKPSGDGKVMVAFAACPHLAIDKETPKPSKSNVDVSQDAGLTDSAALNVSNDILKNTRSILPEFMVPAICIVLPRIPRTASAKVDRKKLASIFNATDMDGLAQSQQEHGGTHEDEASWRRSNQHLLQVVSDISRVPVEDLRSWNRLAAIGVDSIGVIRMLPKLRNLGWNLSMAMILNCATLSELSSITGFKRPEGHGEAKLQAFQSTWAKPVAAFVETDRIQVIPTTPLQESLLSETFQRQDAYWSHHLFRLSDSIDMGRLQRAWEYLTLETEALRTGFIPKASLNNDESMSTAADQTEQAQLLQIIYSDTDVRWQEFDLLQPSFEETVRNISEQVIDYFQQSLFNRPPWTVSIIRQADFTTMMFSIHHSIYDGHSLDLIEKRLQKHYEGQDTNGREHIPQPSDSCSWSTAAAKMMLDFDEPPSMEFWARELDAFDFSADDERFVWQTNDSKHRTINHRMSKTYNDLQTDCKSAISASVTSLLRVTWGLMLCDILEQSAVLFAEVVSERSMHECLEDTVGPLISVIPVPFKPMDSVQTTIDEDQRVSKASLTHRLIRPAAIKALVKRKQSQPLYPAMFAFHPPSDSNPTCPLWSKARDLIELSVEHPLALNVWLRSEDHIDLELSVQEDIMDEIQQHMMLQQFDCFIQAMIECPDMTPAAVWNRLPKHLLSITSPRPNTNCPAEEHPTYWIEHFASTHPNWLAAEIATSIHEQACETQSLTFQQLNSRANQIANFITSQDLPARSMIGLCLGRSLEAYACIVGIFKSGNTYLPIDESLPVDRKQFLLNDSNAQMIFTEEQFFSQAKIPTSCTFVDLASPEYPSLVDQQSTEFATDVNCIMECAAYLLYTSGSTGKPKGVLVSHRNLSSFVEAQSEFICDAVPATKNLAGTGKYLGLASRAFDVHIGEMFLAWRHGLCAVTGPRSVLLDDLGAALNNLGVSHASCVPSLLDQTGLTPEDAPKLVFLGVGGEKMSHKTKKLWGTHHRVHLINAYGPTEATVGCCSGRLFEDTDMKSIGRPLGDSVGHVLIPGTNHHVKRGFPGELCFTGSLIAMGYLNRPDAKGFENDFYGEKMYRTGDIVRLKPDDTIEFLGRNDSQVKIRGQRVELEEVSEGVRMSSEEPINVAALFLKHHQMPKYQLIAFIASSESSSRKNQASPTFAVDHFQSANHILRGSCQKILPVFMVPDLIIPISYLPLAVTSGKADNKFLTSLFNDIPMAELFPQQKGISDLRPRTRDLTRDEGVICNILRSTTSKELPMTPETSIFELGVDSLSAITVFSKMRKAGYDCSIADILRNPLVKSLACLPRNTQSVSLQGDVEIGRTKIADLQARFLNQPSSDLPAGDIEMVRPCLPLQEALVAPAIGGSLHTSYINQIVWTFDGDTDIERLTEAWECVVRRNPILRTIFALFEDHVVQVVLQGQSHIPNFRRLDSKQASDEASWRRLKQQVATNLVQSLTTSPPVHICFWNTNDQCGMMLSIHHALYDGVSINLLLDELHTLFIGQMPDPYLDIQPLLEWIESQDESRAEQHWAKSLEYWRECPLLGAENNGATVLTATGRQISTPLSELLRDVANLNMTLPNLLLGVTAIVLAQKARRNHVIIGSVMSGRNIPVTGAESMSGPCISTIPQAVNLLDAQISVEDFLKHLQTITTDSLEFQHSSPRKIQRWVGANRPLYDCLFSFLPSDDSSRPDSPWKEVESSMPVDYVLAFEFESSNAEDSLTLQIGYDSSIGTETEIQQMMEQIELLLISVIRRDQIPLRTFMFTPAKTNGVSSHQCSENSDDSIWSQHETEVRQIVAEFSGIPSKDIEKHSSFIQMGIDSVTAIRLVKELRKIHVHVSSADIMRCNCIGDLVASYTSMQQQRVPSQVVLHNDSKMDSHAGDDIGYWKTIATQNEVPDLEIDSIVYPCTPLQAGMIVQTLESKGKLYVHHHTMMLEGSVDLSRLKLAWEILVHRLDILRTTFHRVRTPKSHWVGVIRKSVNVSWTEHDPLPNIELESLSQYLTLRDESDFATPPTRVNILRSPHYRLLSISMHHSLYDGESIQMLFRGLYTVYRHAELPVAVPFHRFATDVYHRQQKSVQYWVGQLEGYEGVQSLHDNLNQQSGQQGILVQRTLSNAAGIVRSSQKLNATVQDVCLLAFGKALACFTRQRDVAFGQVLSGRHGQIQDDDHVIGPTFNTVPFRIRLADPFEPIRAALRRCQQTSRQALEHSHASLADIQKQWHQRNPNASTQLIEALFVFQRSSLPSEEHGAYLWEAIHSKEVSAPSEYHLNFEIQQTNSSLIVRAFSKASKLSLDNLLHDFEVSLHDILSGEDNIITAVPPTLKNIAAEHSKPAQILQIDNAAVSSYFKSLAAAVAEVTGASMESISPETSIHSLGIDSITAIQVGSISRRKGLPLGLVDIMQGITMERICGIIASKRSKDLVSPSPASSPALTPIDEATKKQIMTTLRLEQEPEAILPCLAGQEYHLMSWLQSGRTLYEPAWPFIARDRIDVSRIQKAWEKLQTLHSILRTTFVAISKERAVQVILEAPSSNSFKTHRYSTSIKDACQDCARIEAIRPSDMFIPPIRLRLVQADESDAILVIVNHAAYDAWSMPRMIQDLALLYKDISMTRTDQFPLFVQQELQSLSGLEQERFWQGHLGDFQPTILQSQAPQAPQSMNDSDRSQSFVFFKSSKVPLHALTQSKIPAAHLLLLAFSRTLATLTSTIHPCFGLFHLGRSSNFDNVENVVGPCVNLLPFSLPTPFRLVTDVLEDIQAKLAERIPFEQSHLREVLKWTTSGEGELPFNASINILWNHAQMQMANTNSTNLFDPFPIGFPTEFMVSKAIPGITAVDQLDWTLLDNPRIFVDIGPEVSEGSIHFGIRCDQKLMDEEKVRHFGSLLEDTILSVCEEANQP